MDQHVYMYTVTSSGNGEAHILEKYGILTDRITPCGGLKFYELEPNPRRYQTNASFIEGQVRGVSVWFKEPNYDGAIAAFKRDARKNSKLYFQKAIRLKRFSEREVH